MNPLYLEKLRKAYKDKKLVPFIGAGLAIPFGIPGWGELIMQIAESYVESCYIESIKYYVKIGEYWKAIQSIKEFSMISDMDIQEYIVEKIKNKMNEPVQTENHNYLDIAQMNFKNIFTTNYDLFITKYINNPLVIPQVLHKVDINSQLFFNSDDDTHVWHIHGHILDPGSIVISEQKYNELYSNGKYKKVFNIFQANGTFLFLGFSMGDVYIQNILEQNKEFYNSQHYIFLDRPDYELQKELKEKYNVNVISYDSTVDSHAHAIRKLLAEICESSTKGDKCEIAAKADDVKVKICKDIKRLLIENNRIFINYGPKSEAALENPVSDVYEIWEERKREKIIPNNDKIIKIIEDNVELFTLDEYDICYEFIEHAKGFKRSCDSIMEDIKQFPKKFDEVISKYAEI